jgi:hypothetical protein
MQDLLAVESALQSSACSQKLQDLLAVVQRPLVAPAQIPQAPMTQQLLQSASVHLKSLVHERRRLVTEAPPLTPLQPQSAALLHAPAVALVVAVAGAKPPLTLLQLQSAAGLAHALAAALVVLVAAAKPLSKSATVLRETLTMRACHARRFWLFSEVARLCTAPRDSAPRV